MKEYKIINTSRRKAEQLMNDMAREGWEVVCMTDWTVWRMRILITFAKNS